MSRLLYIENVELRVKNYVEHRADVVEESQCAVDCMDCEAFIEAGIEAFQCILRTDTILRTAILSGKLDWPDDVDYDAFFLRLTTEWLKPVPRAETWIRRCQENGYQVERLDEYRKCVEEARAIVNFDENAPTPEAVVAMETWALEGYARGEAAEFLSEEE